MRTNKNTSKIILAVAVAFLATMISYSAFRNMHSQMQEQQKLIEVMQKTQKNENNETYAYAVATVDLKSGEIVSDTDVDFKQFDIQNKDAFENRSDVVNKVLLKDIASGETFTTSHIAMISNDEVSLREGYRALTLPADNFQGKSETMKQGSFVDIYSTANNSSWILEGVRIISFESSKNPIVATASTSGIMDASAITFEVSASDISSFISNISMGKLMLVTRNPNDKPVVHKKSKTGGYGNYSAKSYSSLPNLPSAVPITNLGSHGKNFDSNNFSQLPQPIKPAVQSPSVEVIEANVKSKVTFE
jgi:Flp pilus assembly protein CpaB